MSVDLWDPGFWIGTLTGVGGLLFAFWSYWDTKITKRLEFASYGRSLISPEAIKIGGNKFTVNGRDINALTREYILIVSNGTNSIQFSEVLNHIKLTVQSGEVMAADIISSDDPDNRASIDFGTGGATIKFEYLRPRDALLFYVDHTAYDRSHVRLSFSERERNVVFRRSMDKIDNKGRILSRLEKSSTSIVFLFLIILCFVIDYLTIRYGRELGVWYFPDWLFILLIILSAFMSSSISRFIFKKQVDSYNSSALSRARDIWQREMPS